MVKNKIRVLNIIAIISLLILAQFISFIMQDSPLSWKLFPGDSALLLPIFFFIPLVLSVLSFKNKKSTLAKVTLSISIILLILTGILAIYVFALGSSWKN